MKQRMVGIAFEEFIADFEGAREIPVGQTTPAFRVQCFRGVPLGSYLVVETLILRIAIGYCGFRRGTAEFEHTFEFAERGADFTILIAAERGLIKLLFFRPYPGDLLLTTI